MCYSKHIFYPNCVEIGTYKLTDSPESRLRKVRFFWWLAAFALTAMLLFALGERWAQSTASTTASSDARQLAASNALLFNSELQKFRLLPVALAEYPDVAALLTGEAPSGAVNDRLERLAANTSAAAIYVIRPDGLTVAASNYRLPTGFVGQNYAFRPYFRDALLKGDAELFALGTVSGRPGFYLARRVGDAGRPLGVIVVKIEFDALQREWAKQAGITLVADGHDIVVISGRPEWQFRTLRKLEAAERAEIARNRLFEGSALETLPFDATRSGLTIGGAQFRTTRQPVALDEGSLLVLMPMDRAVGSARAQARTIVVSVLFVLLGLLAWQFRQFERAVSQQAVQRELEDKVAERTAELEEANRQLTIESTERANSEERYRRSREELAQANRLGTLGQVTAGVAHEINQPVAAIRAFAENAMTFLARGKQEKAGENLKQIVGLTERVAAITSELRSFARRKTPAIGATSLAEAIEASLLIVRHRLTGSKTTVKWDRKAAAIAVRADRVRLEQVFVNLIQNSLDAFDGSFPGEISIGFTSDDARVIVVFADNGPGFPKALRPKLFTPFNTGKEDGLGLGLAIVRDIVREFGGDVVLLDGPGAQFELRFSQA